MGFSEQLGTIPWLMISEPDQDPGQDPGQTIASRAEVTLNHSIEGGFVNPKVRNLGEKTLKVCDSSHTETL